MPAPKNVNVERTGATSLSVSWEHSGELAAIKGYRVYYNMVADPEMDKWIHKEEFGVFNQMDLEGLEAHTMYVVRVRAKGDNNMLGEFSEIVTTRAPIQGL